MTTKSDLLARLPEIRARLEAITPGEWATYFNDICTDVSTPNVKTLGTFVDFQDAHFVANAPNDVRDLLEIVDALTDQNKHLRERFEHMYHSLSNDLVHVESFPEPPDVWYKEYEQALRAYIKLCSKVLGYPTEGGSE